jgi:hypothetical protein
MCDLMTVRPFPAELILGDNDGNMAKVKKEAGDDGR